MKFMKISAVGIALLAMTVTSATAASLKLDIGFDVTRGPVAPNTFPSDPNGLDGARFSISSIFDEGTTFQRSFASASSTNVTITGASVATSNGTFSVTDNVGLFQGSTGGGFGLLAGGTFFSFLSGFAVPDIIRSVKLDGNGSVGSQPNNSPVTLALLERLRFRGVGETGSASLFSGFQNSNFRTGNISVAASEISPVPVPASLPLFGTFLAAFGALAMRRRRNKAAAA